MSDSTPVIDIRPDHWEIVQKILQKHVPQYAVWAFGSRAKWTAKAFSDLDLVVITDRPLSLAVGASLSEDFCESDLPYKVDVVDWATTSESFRKIIERDKVVVQEGKSLGGVSGWPTVKLITACGKLGGVQTGPFGSQLHQKDYVLVGTPIITVEHLGENRITRQNLPLVSNEDVIRLKKYTLAKGDIVFSRVGSVDRRSLVRDEETGWLFSGRCLRVRLDPKVADPVFVSLQLGLDTLKEHIRSIAVGATMPSLNTKLLSEVPIILPPLPEQRAIAHILGTLDDKIELNRKQNENLEAMARALFKAWFVDFEPVRAKLEGRWQRGQSLPGLPAHLYDIFPDRLVESELGEIPEGWEVASVDVEFDVTMGQSPPGNTYNETGEGIPFYQGRSDFEFRFPKRRVYCTAPTRLAKNGDTLVSVRAPVGDINMASEDCAIGRGVGAVRHKTRCRSYTYQHMSSISDVFARFDAEGTVFGSIGKKDFHSITHVKPPRALVLAYEKLAAQPDDQIERNERESRSLAQLRDTLLPKLISGELRVPDAAAFLKERGL